MNKYEMGQQVAENMTELDLMGRRYEQKWREAWSAAGQDFLNVFRSKEHKVESGYEQKRHEADEAARFYWDAVGSGIRGFFDPKWGKEHEVKFREEYESGKKTAILKEELGTDFPTDADLICNEERYGLATPQFLYENGLTTSLRKGIDLAECLRQHPEKKNPVFLKGCMVKANAEKEVKTDVSTFDFQRLADDISGKKMEVKVVAPEQAAAHPSPVIMQQQVQQNPMNNPMSSGFMSQFVQGIPLESPAQPVQYNPPVYAGRPQFPQQPEQTIQYDPPVYAQQVPQQPQAAIPMHGNQVMQNLKGYRNFNQPSPVSAPVGYMLKEREHRILQDEGAVLEGIIPQPEVNPPAKKVVPSGAIPEKQDGDDLYAIVKGDHPELHNDSKIINVLKSLKECGYSVAFRQLNNTDGDFTGIYEFHPFNGDQELDDLKFCVDTGFVFDKRMKFCVGASSNFETKDWYPLEVNQGSKLMYFDEILKTFFRKGKRELLKQKPMYNKLWREINKNFIDLSTIPSEALTSNTRKEFNGKVSDLYNCRELQSKLEELCPDGTRFRVDEYDKDSRKFRLTNLNVRTNILGKVRNDPTLITIVYDGTTAVLSNSKEVEETSINVKASVEKL